MTVDTASNHAEIDVRPMVEADIGAARKVYQLAFGTFNAVPDPEHYREDIDTITNRWRMDPAAAWIAEYKGRVIGSNLAANWGSVGFFGPLTIHPEFWNRGVAQKLLEPTMARFEQWGTTHVGLFTYAHSSKHLELYRRYGFWPRFLTAIMSKPVIRSAPDDPVSAYSLLSDSGKGECLAACFELTDGVHPGLDIRSEIEAVDHQQLGDTVLLHDERGLSGLAVCHVGRDTEAGEANCFVKFGLVRGGSGAGHEFDRLLGACETLAAARGRSALLAGTNLARRQSYEIMIDRGFRTLIQGVAMHRGNEPGYNRDGVYLMDDWR